MRDTRFTVLLAAGLMAFAFGAVATRVSATTLQHAGGPAGAGQAVLYLFAHQDDEYFILTRMARDVSRGRDVHAVWITDGAKRGSAERRNAETLAVMKRLGVPQGNIHFLAFPDQGAVGHLAQIHQSVSALAAQHRFCEITTPAYEGGNIDHDVVALVGALVAAEAPEEIGHFEFPLYHHYQGRARVGVFLPHPDSTVEYTRLAAADHALLREAMWTYRSQRWLLLALRLRADRQALRERGEPFRRAPNYDFLARPAHEPCGYEVVRRRRAPFERWLQAVGPFLGQLKIHRAGRGDPE